MSSKTIKKTTTSSTTQHKASTPTKVTKTMQQSSSRASTSSSFSSTPGRVRTPSPARLTRMQEKDELIDLNDRLAKYIDRVRYLETENTRLTIRIQESEEVVTREVSGIKGLYESELAEARRLLDITSKENARLKLDLKTSRGDHDDCKTRCAHKDRDLKDAEKTHKNLENKITELQIALNEAENRQGPLEKELCNLKNDVAALRAQLSTAKKQLEDETMMRIELANRVQTYKEDLDLSRQVHEQELNETRSRLSTTYEEIDGRVQDEYETKLQEALFEIRHEQEQHVQLAKDDIVTMYESKLRDLDNQSQMSNDSAARARAELKITLKKTENTTVELATLKQKIAMLELRTQELDDEVSRERSEREILVSVKDEEIARLKLMTHDQMLEYTDLMDVKLKLDMEIAAYRKLLEGEEARLNLSSGSDSSFQHTPGRGQKRKRPSLFTQSTVNREYMRSGSSQELVEIEEVDLDNGEYIRLYNKGSEEFSLGGWQLKHVAGDLETTYKFHRTAVIKSGSHVTVYSSSSTVTHSPPSDLVMKGQKWFVGDDMQTLLINTQGKERAELHLNRSSLATTQSCRYGQEVEAETKEKCSVM